MSEQFSPPRHVSASATSQLSAAWIIAGIGGAVVAVGSLLPWGMVTSPLGTMSISGVSGDGVFSLILGCALGAVALIQLTTRAPRAYLLYVAIGLSFVTGAFGLWKIGDLNDAIDHNANAFATSAIGPGLHLVIVGAGLAFLGAVLASRRA
jgi:hypothetical protein